MARERLVWMVILLLALAGCAAQPIPGTPEASPPPGLAEAVERGKALLNAGDAEGAIAVLEPVARGDRPSAEALFWLGNAYTQAGHLQEAEGAYRSALDLEPENPDLLSNLGYVLYQMQRPAEAVEQFEKAARLLPHDAEIRYNLGGALYTLGRVEEAIQAFEAARERDPDLPQVYLGLGYAYRDRGEREKAIRHFRTFLELSDDEGWKAQVRQELERLEGK
ncbi:MAG: tetratricopeptide repeat protein [Anaerolineae bacterium]